jgi:hypothetical protein
MLKFIFRYASVAKHTYMRPHEKDCVKQPGKYKVKMYYKITCSTFTVLISVHQIAIYDTITNKMHNITIYNVHLKQRLRHFETCTVHFYHM